MKRYRLRTFKDGFIFGLAAPALLLALLLGGCAHSPGQTSVAGGECKFLERPTYAVRGVRQYDQDWIDSTIEGGVGACGWQRPAPRPSDMDAPKFASVKPKLQVKKPKPWLRLLRGMRREAAPADVASSPAEFEPPFSVAPPAPPRRPIDELLGAVK